MNTKRILFWSGFVIILALIIWGLVVAQQKSSTVPGLGTPPPVTSADHVRGPADAPVTLIEYGDFQCPACGAYYPLVEQLYAQSSSTMRMVFRHFPLPQHQNAQIAAQASEAASDQGQFWGMYQLLYPNQDTWGVLSDADARQVFDGYAKQLGLNVAQFNTDIDSTTTKQIIANDIAEGNTLGISYTPTFFVNGKAIQNPQSYDDFKAIIDSAAQ